MTRRMTRRRCLKSLAGTAAAVAGGLGAAEIAPADPAARPRPGSAVPAKPVRNVLFIVVDDLNQSLGCYGHPVVKSPSADRLAARGVRFDRAYCQFPVCNPSRSSFLTGLRPETTGVLDNRTPLRSKLPDAVTLPRWFRRNGYFTARVGKVFHGGGRMDDPDAWDAALDPRGTPRGRKGTGRNLTGGKVKWCRWLAADGTDEDQMDGQVAREAVRLLERARGRPFFLGVGFHKPHDPFVAPKKYFDLYPLDRLRPPTDPADRTPDLPLAIASAWKREFDKFTDRERREFMRAYFAGVSFMDAQVGKVLDALDRRKLAGETLVVFFGDHGYHLGVRGWWNKNTLFEPSCRAPLIVAGPEMKARGAAGKRCAGIVEFVDLYPTLVDVCGLRVPGKLEGESFRRLLADPARPGKKAAFTVVKRGPGMGRSVRTDRWRYTEWGGGKLGVELYDHKTDPSEYYNLASKPAHRDTIAGLKELLATQTPPAT
jgi:iduronate 2-sulfatase